MWTLLFVGEEGIDETRRRLRLVGEGLDGCVHRRGRRVALSFSKGGMASRLLCRIERFDPNELRLDIIARDGDRAGDWAQAAKIGDPVEMELVAD